MISGFRHCLYQLASLARGLLTTIAPRIYVLIACCLLASLSLFAPPLQAQSPPPIPTNIRASRITPNSVTMRWDKSPGATSYEVASEELLFTPFWRDVGDVSSYTFTGLDFENSDTANPHYESLFYVRAKNSAGFSNGAVLVVRGPDILVPPEPRDDNYDYQPPPSPTPTATPIRDTLNHLPPGIQVSNWVDGAQGRRVGPAGVGRADLIEQGILDAFDIWAYVTPGVEVCFAQYGRAVFLDAAYAPRRPFDLPSYQRAGQTCVTIDRAGTVVLLRGGTLTPTPQASQPERTQPQSLSGCEVRPWANVNFRQSPPSGRVLGVTGASDWLPASEKRYGYFKVRLWGLAGWISGDYVYTRGNCRA